MSSGMDKLEQYLKDRGAATNTGTKLLREVVYDRLFDAIRTVRLRPGDALSEPRISKALGISRTPVREALHLLTQEGLLEIIPGRAVLVASPSTQKIFDALQLRELLEPEMMKMVAETMPPENLEELRKTTCEMETAAKAGDRSQWSIADNRWHELISRSCPNRLLGDMVFQVRNRVIIISADENVSNEFLVAGTVEHKRIVDAITEKNGDRAMELVAEHLKNLREDILKRYNIAENR